MSERGGHMRKQDHRKTRLFLPKRKRKKKRKKSPLPGLSRLGCVMSPLHQQNIPLNMPKADVREF
jgi:hypothetical protein